jgi:hypothetical protein
MLSLSLNSKVRPRAKEQHRRIDLQWHDPDLEPLMRRRDLNQKRSCPRLIVTAEIGRSAETLIRATDLPVG